MISTRTLLFAISAGVWLGWSSIGRGDDSGIASDVALLQAAGHKADGSALLDFFRRRTLSDAQKKKLGDTVRMLGDNSFRVREKASADLVAAGRAAIPFLRVALKDPDLEIARRAEQCLEKIESRSETSLITAAIRILAAQGPRQAMEVLLAYLCCADDEMVEEEILAGLAMLAPRQDKEERLLRATLADKVISRRAAAGFLLGRSSIPESQALVRPLLKDPEPLVRLRAAQGLVAGKDKTAIPILVALLSDGPAAQAWQAEEILFRIAGDKSPHVSIASGDAKERLKCREAWAAWWSENGPKVDLKQLNLEQRLLGLTLIAVLDGGGRGAGGRVWEIGPDGKPRWEISSPAIDAEMLPGGRVLVAEYNSRRVAEYDIGGKLLWEQKVNGPPVTAHRLPDGNTLVAYNQEIVEFTPDGKQAASISSLAGTVYSVQKLRNGNWVYVTSDAKLYEVDRTGKELRSFLFDKGTYGLTTVEVLPNGHYLIPMTQSGKVGEFDRTGKIVWECSVPSPNAAARLPNGHILACGMNSGRVVEVNREGKVVWETKFEGRPFRVRRR